MKQLPSQIALTALLMFLVGNPVQSTFADTPDPVVITVTETIAVADDPSVVGPAVIAVTETIAVADDPIVADPAVITVTETIAVADDPIVAGPAVITVTETIAVADDPSVVGPAVIAVTETIAVADDSDVAGPAVISVTETVTVAESVESSDPKLELLLSLSQPAFFGDVTEVAEDRFMVTTNPEVLLLITNDTVINSPGTTGNQQIAVGQRVAVVANEAPAIGVDLSDKDLATALTVTVIPEKALRHHRQCAAVKKEGQNMTLACDDGTTVEISASQLSPGDSVVILFQPEQPERLVTTGTRLLERLERMTSRATGQGQAELASKLNNMQENTKKNFGAKFGGIRDAAPPDLQALMNDMISSIEKLTGAVVAGDTQVAIGADDLAQVSTEMEQMLGFMDQMTEIMVKRRLNKISEKAREVVEETVRSQIKEFMAQVQRDMEKALQELRDGDVEDAIVIMEEMFRRMEEESDAGSIRTQVRSILDQLRPPRKEQKEDGAGRKVPDITLSCPSTAQIGKQVECTFRSSGKVESITWSVPGGNPDFIEQPTFTSESPEKNLSTRFEVPGTFEVSLEACNQNGCTVGTSSIVATESVPIQTEKTGKAPEITIQCPSSAQTGRKVECAFRYSGKVETITWSAPGGNPETGSDSNFVTQYAYADTFQISLTACLGNSCSEAKQTVVVDNAPPNQS